VNLPVRVWIALGSSFLCAACGPKSTPSFLFNGSDYVHLGDAIQVDRVSSENVAAFRVKRVDSGVTKPLSWSGDHYSFRIATDSLPAWNQTEPCSVQAYQLELVTGTGSNYSFPFQVIADSGTAPPPSLIALAFPGVTNPLTPASTNDVYPYAQKLAAKWISDINLAPGTPVQDRSSFKDVPSNINIEEFVVKGDFPRYVLLPEWTGQSNSICAKAQEVDLFITDSSPAMLKAVKVPRWIPCNQATP